MRLLVVTSLLLLSVAPSVAQSASLPQNPLAQFNQKAKECRATYPSVSELRQRTECVFGPMSQIEPVKLPIDLREENQKFTDWLSKVSGWSIGNG